MKRSIVLTTHAAERYQERVRPALDTERARDELEHLIHLSEATPEPPCWTDTAQEGDQYLNVSDGVCVVLERGESGRLHAVTVLTRGEMSAGARAARNARKAQLRRARRARNRKGSDRQGVDQRRDAA